MIREIQKIEHVDARYAISDDDVFDRAVRAVEALAHRGRYDLLTLVATHVNETQQIVSKASK